MPSEINVKSMFAAGFCPCGQSRIEMTKDVRDSKPFPCPDFNCKRWLEFNGIRVQEVIVEGMAHVAVRPTHGGFPSDFDAANIRYKHEQRHASNVTHLTLASNDPKPMGASINFTSHAWDFNPRAWWFWRYEPISDEL